MNRTSAQLNRTSGKAGDVATSSARLAKASVKDSLAVFAEVAVPTFSKGAIVRRPRMVALSERLDLEGRAVRRMQHLRAKYGQGPLLLATPVRKQALILSPEHVRRVLGGAPEPFAPSTVEKQAALAHFEPRVSLASHGEERAVRRRFNEDVLQSGSLVHGLADAFVNIVDEEAQRLLAAAEGQLDWDGFVEAWYRVVRRVVLGRGARDDHELTDQLAKLRGAANWAFLHPGRPALMRRFHENLAGHLSRGEEGSLAALIAARAKTAESAPTDQVAHYLFAFDPGGMATFRALALLAAHPQEMDRARQEAAEPGHGGWTNLRFLRACMLESLRLWPTTPAIFRETTQETDWGGRPMPQGTHILIFAPFFHRDDESLPYAHSFAPGTWLSDQSSSASALVPFSAGPGKCPARNLVPMLASAMLAAIISRVEVGLEPPDRLSAQQPLPSTLDNYSLHFAI